VVATVLVIGTSGLVTPAAYIPHAAKEVGARLIEINPEPTPLTDHADEAIMGLL
jgi:NAD-dependent deacetylase